MATPPVHRSFTSLPEKFTGDADWDSWLCMFEVCAQANGWTDDDKKNSRETGNFHSPYSREIQDGNSRDRNPNHGRPVKPAMRSLNDYFENLAGESTIRKVGNTRNSSEVVLVVDGSQKSLAAAASTIMTESLTARAVGNRSTSGSKTLQLPETFKLISWNIDGIEEKNLKLRAEAVCKIIAEENADVVFLQEVVPVTASIIECALPRYKCLFAQEVEYFTGVLLKQDSVWYEDHSITSFPESRMGRNLLSVKIKLGEKKVQLLTSHLESTSEHSEERVNQLKAAFKAVAGISKDQTVIFGGDLNLRDKELASVGGIPDGMQDLWISCGSRKECAYTWDMTRNDNLAWNGRFKPRCRFDRVYIRKGTDCNIVPKHFGLLGLERLLPHRCFPSDHWGLLCIFNVSQ